MRPLGVYFRLAGWAVVLGLVASQLAYYSDGHGGLMVAAASVVLMWRMVATLGPLVPGRGERASSADAAPRASTLLQRP